MKRLFNILIITLVSVVSLFSFSMVHARLYATCEYGVGDENYKIIIEGDAIKEISSSRNCSNSYVKCEHHITASQIIVNNKCRSDIYEVSYLDGKTTYFSLYSKKNKTTHKDTRLNLVKETIVDCVPPEDALRNPKYSFLQAEDFSSIEKDISSIDSKISGQNSLIQQKTGINGTNTYGLKYINESTVTCEQLNNYEYYTINKLNPLLGNGKKFNVNVTSKIQTKLGQYDELKNVCNDGSAASKKISNTLKAYREKLEAYQSTINSFNSALAAIGDRVSDLRTMKKCSEDPDRLKEMIDESIAQCEAIIQERLFPDVDFAYSEECSILGGDFLKFLQLMLFYIRLVAIVLAVVLSLLDYIKATAGSDDKPMSKANKNFVTRIILIIVLFLLPAILTFVLDTLKISNATGDSITCLDLDK